MKCIRCGRDFSYSSKFCPYCGTKINKPVGDIHYKDPAFTKAGYDRRYSCMPKGIP